ncbi:hypothetical protein Tco_0750074 [Tanacetum coccineum]|uniref:Reverse transcriptase domain-containing protein n=1 Tax=Tanacetum coccineum TaxID=301880 RepID=A0ABQ4Z085_9ASTR
MRTHRSGRTSLLAYDPEVKRSARLRRKAVRQFSTNLDFAGLKELFTKMSGDDDATGAESPPRGVDSYYRPGNFEDPSPIVYPAAANGAMSNFKIQPNLIAILPVFRGREEPYAHLREFFSIADTYQVNNTTKDGVRLQIVPIPRESEDTSRSDSKNVLPSCDDFSSINVPRDDSVTFFNPLFEFDVNFNSSDINPLFDEELEDIECKDSYPNLDESTFLVTPLSDSNKDECLTPEDDIEILLHHDPSTPLKSVASILEGFIDDPPFEENDDLFDLECKTNDWKRILYDAPIDEAECFDSGGDNDEIEAFLAIEIPTYIEGYYDLEGDVIYLESLLSDDATHNLSPEVFFNHKPQHDTFSPKSDPLHHEFTGELITIPPGIIREQEDYINRMSLLCGNSSSRSPENSHTIIESLPSSTTLIEDSDANREEIDIFSRPDIKSDFDSEEDIIDNLLNDDPISKYERLTFNIEPDAPVINNVDELNEDKCFDPGGGEINVEVDDSFTFVIQTFLSYLTYPVNSPFLYSFESEDTIFYPGIST